jgi:hypothetical protein
MTTARTPATGSPLGIKGRREANAPSVDESTSTKLLPFVLSVTAASVDIIGFLGLDGLFTLLARDLSGIASAKKRARHTWPAIDGFLVGCVLAAAAVIGLRSLVLPAGLALLALAMGIAANRHTAQSSSSIPEERPA